MVFLDSNRSRIKRYAWVVLERRGILSEKSINVVMSDEDMRRYYKNESDRIETTSVSPTTKNKSSSDLRVRDELFCNSIEMVRLSHV